MGFESTCSKNLEKPYGDTQSTFEARLITRLTRELAKIQAAGFPEAVGLGRPGLCALKALKLFSYAGTVIFKNYNYQVDYNKCLMKKP